MSTPSMIVSAQTARRFLLGLQGLWPGRRWAGKDGAARAIRALGAVQVDPMTVVARSHDLTLWARVAQYRSEHLDTLLYRDRLFFDYGGGVHIYPMDELPYWRVHMTRRRLDARPRAFFAEHAAVTDAVRKAVRDGGPLGSRDLEGHARVSSYRARKDTGLALYNLWLTGDLMTHSRDGFQRVYDLRERVAPSALDRLASEDEAEEFFARKALHMLGLHTASAWASRFAFLINRKVGRTEARVWLDRLVGEETFAIVEVEGERDPYCYLASDAPYLTAVAGGEIPEAWRPLDTTTEDEAVFLSPLDSLLARKRTRELFDFDYLWEVYKPADRRRWGYYTMPILWRDRLVGRLDPKLDRQKAVLVINGLWLEDDRTADDAGFTLALAWGLERFATFHDARVIALRAVQHAALRADLESSLTIQLA